MSLQASQVTAITLVCDAIKFQSWKLFYKACVRKIRRDFLCFLLNLKNIMNESFDKPENNSFALYDTDPSSIISVHLRPFRMSCCKAEVLSWA